MADDPKFLDYDVEKALDWLRDRADDIANAKYEAVKTEKMLSHVRAMCMKHSNQQTSAAQERDALCMPEYVEAVEKMARAAAEYEKQKALREAAELKIQAWQTTSANYRAMRI